MREFFRTLVTTPSLSEIAYEKIIQIGLFMHLWWKNHAIWVYAYRTISRHLWLAVGTQINISYQHSKHPSFRSYSESDLLYFLKELHSNIIIYLGILLEYNYVRYFCYLSCVLERTQFILCLEITLDIQNTTQISKILRYSTATAAAVVNPN